MLSAEVEAAGSVAGLPAGNEQERLAHPDAVNGAGFSAPQKKSTKRKADETEKALLQELAASFQAHAEVSAAGERRYGADDYEDFEEDEYDEDEDFDAEYERGGWTAPSFASAMDDAEGSDENQDDESDGEDERASLRPSGTTNAGKTVQFKLPPSKKPAATPGAGSSAAAAPVSSSTASSAAAAVLPAVGKDGGAGSGANRQPLSLRDIHAQPKEHVLDRYREKINLNILEAKTATGTIKHTGRDDRATVEQVLDPRTRLILFKLLSQNVISEIHGCVSTGKEANVYHAFRPDGTEVAIKIYKTSILVFKDRDRYVTGEYRFASGYSRSNPRKMVKLWAEKETRNLKRLNGAGLPCPAPLMLRLHVLLMDFVGSNGVAAPRLKDAHLNEEESARAYLECCDIIRAMFQRCRLVHADLSEYNLLWHRGHVVVIDVSQSVEREHPRALEFLRIDCNNITDFFRRLGVALLLTPRELFDFVVHPGLTTPEEEQAYLEAVLTASLQKRKEQAAAAASGTATAAANAESVEHAVFMQAFIPQSLSAVRDAEAETALVAKGGDVSGLYHATMTGLTSGPVVASTAAKGAAGGAAGSSGFAVKVGSGASAAGAGGAGAGAAAGIKKPMRPQPDDDDSGSDDGTGSNLSTDSEDEDDDSEDGDDDGEDGEEGEGGNKHKDDAYTRRGMTKEEKKAHKAAVKEEKKAKRATKIPKHVKKRHAKAKK
jgi:RIO kinase 1